MRLLYALARAWAWIDSRMHPTPFVEPAAPVAVGLSDLYVWRTYTTANTEVIDVDPTGEVIHLGVEGWTARDLAPLAPLTEEAKAKILEDTGAFDVLVFVEEEDAAEFGYDKDPMMVESNNLIEDELGSWDPDAVDWEEPAIFREVAADALRAGALHPPIAETEFIDAIMRRVLEPA